MNIPNIRLLNQQLLNPLFREPKELVSWMGVLDLWEGEYTYRCILTNDYESSTREIVEFYNLRGGKERIFDDMNNGFGWDKYSKPLFR